MTRRLCIIEPGLSPSHNWVTAQQRSTAACCAAPRPTGVVFAQSRLNTSLFITIATRSIVGAVRLRMPTPCVGCGCWPHGNGLGGARRPSGYAIPCPI
ncbi:hypothetical protein SPI_01500 [Niveomyces insectorum RCEF 264]|uniref:Uncharacterized protein n=1 Tax=Niveomyces insectorum RCEF 264 TaxID=1081102 RepID=A0A167Z0G8_9HYPO|nr:hypothetical protein SPI_01500 [Niveomyces insectorum RCEF 264]